jgi:hypothetical protein
VKLEGSEMQLLSLLSKPVVEEEVSAMMLLELGYPVVEEEASAMMLFLELG